MDSQILQGKNLPYEKIQGKFVIGKKQTLRFLAKDEVSKVFISKDADVHVTKEIIDICKEKNIEIIYFDNMKELGRACNIDVNAAAAAVLK
ncbi:MAG TPA: 50S ribosomal protein L7ae-like protein [Clostridiales bacterium]|nr:50S ribosomal protein L7ae-like protein [Clostridiales bacterium]